ncbi:hypothetical protein BCR33DRAFT_720881 [Rhizoclosmatium globosum]|uniref:Uncharacterized protein n=1 Tax=Rhizoclosmatium globosum TaxID=329046 RepID=A0A1Y2BTV9_9FUNG|nr:hypothetical protein BCR33DRAFT_720881 [Rhizoclosmatium globosum]|eukprot:ORY38173.1 hypothetical protein BCR33DRAFT_720881 [Rhizoclosmatium globosum]
MSWHKLNVYNLYKRTQPIEATRRSVFQQKWTAKRDLRAYHVPNITEKQLLARHWKSQLPLSQMSVKETESQPPVQKRCRSGSRNCQRRKMPVPARRLNPGDLISIDPKVVVTLIPQKTAKTAPETVVEAETEKAIDAEPQTVAPPAEKKAKTVASEDSKEDGKEVVERSPSAPESEKAEAAAGAKEPKEKKLSQLDLLVKKHPKSLPFFPLPFMAPWMFIPAYLEVCYNTCSTVFLRTPLPQPNSVEIPSPHAPDMHALAYEWYSSIKRSKTKRPPPAEPLVVNGRSVRLKTKFDSIVRARLKQERDERWAVWAKRDEDARIRAVEAKESKVAEKKA